MEHPHTAHANVFRHLFVCRHIEADPRLPVYWLGDAWMNRGFVAVCGDCSTVAEEVALFGVCERCHFDAPTAATLRAWHAERDAPK